MKLSDVLARAQEKVREAYELRTEVQKASRRVIKLAKRAIFAAHRRELTEARELLAEARSELVKLRELLMERPDVAGLGILNPAYQELAEAEVFSALMAGSEPPAPEDIGIPHDQYLLGLADVIGELRRQALEAMRDGKLADAERFLSLMEEIYMELISLDEAQAILSELRHKCDIGRRLIEATRGEIAVEARRAALREALARLEEALARGSSAGSVQA